MRQRRHRALTFALIADLKAGETVRTRDSEYRALEDAKPFEMDGRRAIVLNAERRELRDCAPWQVGKISASEAA